MAYIVKFSVTGLAGRTSVAQTLDRHLNVFFGLNGSGKTSLLKILDAAMEDTTDTLVNVPFEFAEVLIYSEDFQRTFTRTLRKSAFEKPTQITQSSDSRSVASNRESDLRNKPLVAWHTEPNLQGDNAPEGFFHGYLPITRLYSWDALAMYRLHYESVGTARPDEQLDKNFAQMLQALWTSYYAGVLAEVRQAQEEGLASILQAVLAAHERENQVELDPELAFNRVTSFLRRQGSPQAMPSVPSFRSRYLADARLRSVVSDIDVVERRIAAATAPRSRFQEMITKLFLGKSVSVGDNQISVLTDTKQVVDLALLSSGEKQVLRILVETLSAGPNTLLIDEPELSMHVDWQQELISLMRELNPGAQLILATHSPEIMAEINDENIFRI